jgi:tRNA(Ile)-lysidine synthase
LLDCDRIQVRIFLVDQGLAWRRDYSNFDVRLDRARVRHGFLPALGHELNPRLGRTLAELADQMREEDVLLDRLARPRRVVTALATPVLGAIEPPLARRAIRIWWRRHGSGQRLGRNHVEAIRRLAARGSDDGEVAAPGGAIVREHRQIALSFGWRSDRHTRVGNATRCRRRARHARRLATLPHRGHIHGRRRRPNDATCLVDADRVGSALTVRNRRPGDRLRAHGLGGHTSLKRLMSSRHVSRHLRADHPVIVCDGEVLWVPGCARSEAALVGPDDDPLLDHPRNSEPE